MDGVILHAASGSLPQLRAHTNPGLEIVYVERGNLSWQVEGSGYRVPAGSVFFTMPWERHGSLSEFEPGHRWHFAIFDVGSKRFHSGRKLNPAPVFGDRSRAGREVMDTIRSAPVRCLPCTARMAFLLRAIIAENSCDRAWSPDVLAALARCCLIELARCVMENARPGRDGSVPWRVRNFLKKLPGRTDQPWSLAAMAAECGLGRTHFANSVRLLTGDSPLDHLRRLRIEQARTLLKQPGRTITDISLSCGFASSQHFARVFKKFTGIPASSYRQQNAIRGG